MEPWERSQLRKVMTDEDRIMARADEVLARRDALLRALRWGTDGRPGVAPADLREATVSIRHPNGIGRSTLQRATGRVKDRRLAEPRTSDEQE